MSLSVSSLIHSPSEEIKTIVIAEKTVLSKHSKFMSFMDEKQTSYRYTVYNIKIQRE